MSYKVIKLYSTILRKENFTKVVGVPEAAFKPTHPEIV